MVDMESGQQAGVDPAEEGSQPDRGGVSSEERTWAVWAHLSGAFGLLLGLSFVGPLVIWLVKRDDGEFVADQAREALNFHIVVFVALAVAAVTLLCVIGVVLLPALWIGAIVLSIAGAMKANDGERYRYPYIFRILT